MFLEQISDAQCKEIMKILLSRHYNATFSQFIINESVLQRESEIVRLRFPVKDMCNSMNQHLVKPKIENRCVLEDFEARILITGEKIVCIDKVNEMYRTMMFNKFGKIYQEKLQEYLNSKMEVGDERVQV